MKKTLIALAVMSTVLTSGSAMAWTANGTGGEVSIGGTLTPDNSPVWEVLLGSGISALDAELGKGVKQVTVPVDSNVLVLGIRSVSKSGFKGATGITPVIEYTGINSWDSTGKGNIVLDIKDESGTKIGQLGAKLTPGGVLSYKLTQTSEAVEQNLASSNGDANTSAFSGGFAPAQTVPYSTLSAVKTFIDSLGNNISANYTDLGATIKSDAPTTMTLTSPNATYSAYYGSGMIAGDNITLTLDNELTSTVSWTASMPVTVTYM